MNDDMLTLYYYNDGLTADERQHVCNALAADSELADRYRQLSNALSGIRDTESEVLDSDRLRRFHDVIDRAALQSHARARPKSGTVHFWSFFWGAAVTAALATGIGIGVWVANTDAPASEETRVVELYETPATDPTAAFNRSMRVHFRDSRNSLVNMPLESSADRMTLILQLVEQNRLYERVARQNSAPNLARVLRAFEPILLRLAEEDIAPQDAEALRAQLAFELNVMLTKLAQPPSDESHST